MRKAVELEILDEILAEYEAKGRRDAVIVLKRARELLAARGLERLRVLATQAGQGGCLLRCPGRARCRQEGVDVVRRDQVDARVDPLG